MTNNHCAECGAEFTSQEDLRQHRTDRHPRISKTANRAQHTPAYECPLCDGEFPSDEELRAHARKAHPVTVAPPKMPEDPARPDQKGPPIVT
jgi:ribosomal protein L34E